MVNGVAMHDAELKDNLKQFETLVTKQGTEIGTIRDTATSGMQALDSKYGQAVATLEGVLIDLSHFQLKG